MPAAGAGIANRLSVYYMNCRSLLPKMDELRCLAMNNRPDIIGLVETWLDDSIGSRTAS